MQYFINTDKWQYFLNILSNKFRLRAAIKIPFVSITILKLCFRGVTKLIGLSIKFE
jgi:hypothetical protein